MYAPQSWPFLLVSFCLPPLMGVDITTYRAAIGVFYSATHRSLSLPKLKIRFNFSFKLCCALSTFALLALGGFLKHDKFTFYKIILLMICMDIHPNPGPNNTNTIHTLDILHLNTRSIRNKMNSISDLSESYQILCFSETHLDDTIDSSLLLIEGFDNPLRKDRTRNGGGVMVYISSILNYKIRPDLENQRLETIWFEIKLKSQIILFCCYYRSDFNSSQSTFIRELQPSIEQALDYTPNVILLGDINVDFLNLSNYEILDCLTLFNLSNVINEPTRVSGNSSTLIDPILVSDACRVLDAGTISVDNSISDHKATFVSVKTETPLLKSYTREVWNYKNANFEELNEKIRQHVWDHLIRNTISVDEACANFTEAFIQLCESSIPRKKVIIRPSDRPWFNSELRHNIRLRDRLRRKALKTNNNQDKIRYKTQRNRVNNIKKHAKETYMNNYEDLILNQSCGSKATPLRKLFNLSLQKKSFPILWKLAHVMPIFKKGDKSQTNNYRPISLVSCVGKAFERVIFKHVYNHLITNSLIYQYQSGFLPGHSTVHHLIELVHNTCLALEKYEMNCQIFCDISKAFDRVWHRGLLLKLKNYGIDGNLLVWFEDYLKNRNQKVFINNTFSTQKPISAGVPQGSVLGPLLFLIYINDISDDLTGLARLFADDTSLSYSSADIRQIELILNEDLRKLSEWARKWCLFIFK